MSTDHAIPRVREAADPAHSATSGHRDRHPRAALRELLIGYGTAMVVLLATGWLLTRALDGSVGSWDLDVNQWFAARRVDSWTSLSGFLSLLLDTLSVIGIASVAVAFFAWRHRLHAALVIAVGLALEITVFLSVTFLVERSRPDVARLSAAPMTSSFPSGHTAAAVVLYGGIALGICSQTRNRLVRGLVWISVGIVVIGVGVARVYRGMHHPTDVVVGAGLGAMCLWFAWHAVAAYFGRDGGSLDPEAVR